MDKKMVPAIGQEIYVPTSLYISHGEDDVLGGRATVMSVSEEKLGNRIVHCITVKEHPSVTYYWETYLAEYQEEWEQQFGDQRAKPIPDNREEFNSGSIITIDVIRRWLQEGKERGATHVIIISDTFDYTYYPVYVMPGENPRKKAKQETGKQTSVKEVYSLSHDIEAQLANYPNIQF
jgi:hypothetical protein